MDIMKSCGLDDLPAPPAGKTGWPWTVGTARMPGKSANGRTWPKISIVTPSYNQRAFVEETIRSVLLQGYPNLEFIVRDGASNDGTVDIIRKYSKWMSHWTSEPDGGQIDALHKGFLCATGDILNWLNSDDLLLPGALFAIAELFTLTPGVDIVSGARLLRSARSGVQIVETAWDQWPMILAGIPYFSQETTFFSRRIWEHIGKFDETLEYGFDRLFYVKAFSYASKVVITANPIGVMHVYPEQKSLRKDETMRKTKEILHEAYFSKLGWFQKALIRTCHTRLWVIAEAILRCVVYRRGKGKILIGGYKWIEEEWVLTPF
jgi:glycosyltransferase involved in cell wall biosynthesis